MSQPQVGGDLVGPGVHTTALDHLEPARGCYRKHYAHNNNSNHHLGQGEAALTFPGPLPTHLSHSRPQLRAPSESFRASELFRTLTAEATVRDVLRWERPSFLPISVWQRSL